MLVLIIAVPRFSQIVSRLPLVIGSKFFISINERYDNSFRAKSCTPQYWPFYPNSSQKMRGPGALVPNYHLSLWLLNSSTQLLILYYRDQKKNDAGFHISIWFCTYPFIDDPFVSVKSLLGHLRSSINFNV